MDETNHDVLFVDETHRKKFLVKACDTSNEARALAKDLSVVTGLPLEVYSPRPIQPRSYVPDGAAGVQRSRCTASWAWQPK